MRLMAMKTASAFAAILAMASPVAAAEVCEFSVADIERDPTGVRIAKIACEEHALWRMPFIDAQGRIVRLGPMEAEREQLSDGSTAAWRRVLRYWRESGLLENETRWEKQQIASGREEQRNGATDCDEDAQDWHQKASCRAFLIDVPWSATFVSYVMKKADVTDFTMSSAHYYYLRAAVRDPKNSPYRILAPHAEKPEVGDLVCYVREKSRMFEHKEFVEHLRSENGRRLDAHCDIVVGVDLNADSKLYAIGGNVIHGVTMRKLNLNAKRLLSLPMKQAGGDATSLARHESSFNFNRQNWVALLKLNR